MCSNHIGGIIINCPNCNRPYDKYELTVCSNSFHCCRDCKREAGEVVEFCSEDCAWFYNKDDEDFIRIMNEAENGNAEPWE